MGVKVAPVGTLAIKPVRGAYPFMARPAVYNSDYFPESPSKQARVVGGEVDPVTGAFIARRLDIPHHQKANTALPGADYVGTLNAYVDTALPAVYWDVPTLGANTKVAFVKKLPDGEQGLEYFCTDDHPENASVEVTCDQMIPQGSSTPEDLRCQAFTIYLRKSIGAAGGSATAGRDWKVTVTIGDPADPAKRAVRQITADAFSGQQWTVVADPGGAGESRARSPRHAVPDGSVPGNGFPDSRHGFSLTCEYRCGQLALSVGGGAPLLYALDPDEVEDVAADPYVRALTVEASQFDRCEIALVPAKWTTTASVTPQARANTSYIAPDTADPRFDHAGEAGAARRGAGQPWAVTHPSGSTVTTSPTSGTGYSTTISNPSAGTWGGQAYSDNTAAVSRVASFYPGLWEFTPCPPTYLIPKRVRETTQFDPNSLTVHHTLEITLDNWMGQWAGQCGAIAVQLYLGYSNPAWGVFPRFTGVADEYSFTRPRGNISWMTMHCRDMMWQFNRPIGAPPDFDGMNHYWVIAYLAQYCGFTKDFMAFRDLVPDDPYEGAPGDPAPYFLPFGTGMNPWTPRNRILPVIELMNYIRRPTGFLLYIDALGYLRYEKWLPELAGAPTRVFTESASDDLTEMKTFSFRTSVRNVKNQVVLMGIDQFSGSWNPIVQQRVDLPSIDAPPGLEPGNYRGAPDSFVWVDPRFSNPAFASDAADRVFEILRIPELAASLSAWMQPDIYPMSVIQVDEHKTGAHGVPFYVLGTMIDVGLDGGQLVCDSQITGRFLV